MSLSLKELYERLGAAIAAGETDLANVDTSTPAAATEQAVVAAAEPVAAAVAEDVAQVVDPAAEPKVAEVAATVDHTIGKVLDLLSALGLGATQNQVDTVKRFVEDVKAL